MLTPVLEKFAAKQQSVRVGKVNVDENQQLAASFQIMSIPTMILFQAGSEKKRLMGLKSLAELESDLAEWL
jgi:thioredoxin 1